MPFVFEDQEVSVVGKEEGQAEDGQVLGRPDDIESCGLLQALWLCEREKSHEKVGGRGGA